MKLLVMALLVLLASCEQENISMCGYACKHAGSQMVSYSAADGCRCSAPDAGAAR